MRIVAAALLSLCFLCPPAVGDIEEDVRAAVARLDSGEADQRRRAVADLVRIGTRIVDLSIRVSYYTDILEGQFQAHPGLYARLLVLAFHAPANGDIRAALARKVLSVEHGPRTFVRTVAEVFPGRDPLLALRSLRMESARARPAGPPQPEAMNAACVEVARMLEGAGLGDLAVPSFLDRVVRTKNLAFLAKEYERAGDLLLGDGHLVESILLHRRSLFVNPVNLRLVGGLDLRCAKHGCDGAQRALLRWLARRLPKARGGAPAPPLDTTDALDLARSRRLRRFTLLPRDESGFAAGERLLLVARPDGSVRAIDRLRGGTAWTWTPAPEPHAERSWGDEQRPLRLLGDGSVLALHTISSLPEKGGFLSSSSARTTLSRLDADGRLLWTREYDRRFGGDPLRRLGGGRFVFLPERVTFPSWILRADDGGYAGFVGRTPLAHATADGRIAVLDGARLRLLGADGAPIWRRDGIETEGEARLASSRESLFLGAGSRLRALSLVDGARSWACELAGPIQDVAHGRGRILVALRGRHGVLLAGLDPRSGEVVWREPLPVLAENPFPPLRFVRAGNGWVLWRSRLVDPGSGHVVDLRRGWTAQVDERKAELLERDFRIRATGHGAVARLGRMVMDVTGEPTASPARVLEAGRRLAREDRTLSELLVATAYEMDPFLPFDG